MKCKSKHQLLVEKFMQLAGQEIPESPRIPDEKTRRLRAKLIFEEAIETIQALGFCFEFKKDEEEDIVYLDIADKSTIEPDLERIIDGCCDIKVVTTGTLSACGVPDEIFQTEVDINNLMKFGEGSRINEYGKLVKPDNFQGPRIKDLLKVLEQS